MATLTIADSIINQGGNITFSLTGFYGGYAIYVGVVGGGYATFYAPTGNLSNAVMGPIGEAPGGPYTLRAWQEDEYGSLIAQATAPFYIEAVGWWNVVVAQLSVGRPATYSGWYNSAYAQFSIARIVGVLGWYNSAYAQLSVTRMAASSGWYNSAVAILNVSRGAASSGWYNSALAQFSIARKGVEPPPPDGEGGINWPAVAIAGGVVVTLAAVAATHKGQIKSVVSKIKRK
ncbi:MAG: hypothetical protein PHI12_08550 [Dehalococcoidales bacterium]|nr:hypothetical protein [Dehalococcoidales bacterium]